MSSSERNGGRIPLQDISNTHSSDPKGLKRQRDKERYAQNKDDILNRRREAYKQKKAAAAILNCQNNEPPTPMNRKKKASTVCSRNMEPHTPLAISYEEAHVILSSSNCNEKHTPFQDIGNSHESDPKELKRQKDRERYSQNRDKILRKQREACKHKKSAADILNCQDTAPATPVTLKS